MGSSTPGHGSADKGRRRVLIVADWTVDAHAVVAACTARANGDQPEFGLLVPAWLHGLDWVGDPHASRPCARRQVDSIGLLARARGIDFALGAVGDPDVLTAICDALSSWPADELILCARARLLRVAHPFDLARRARRLTGLMVERQDLRSHDAATWQEASMRRRVGHCGVESAPAVLT